MACWACKYGDDCCEGVRADVAAMIREGDLTLALIQAPRMCQRCIEWLLEEVTKAKNQPKAAIDGH